MAMLTEFRDFALKGNVIDLAVGVIIGGAFGKIVDSMVKDIIMPIVGAIFGGLDFSSYFLPLTTKIPEGLPHTYEAYTKAGVAILAYGNFITNFLNFAFIIFQMVNVFNKAKNALIKAEAAKPAAPPEDVVLLREIRDELKKGR